MAKVPSVSPCAGEGVECVRGRGQFGGRRRARRTGVLALAVLCGSSTVTLLIARQYHLDLAAPLVAILGGLPALYLAWSAYRGQC